MWIAIVCIGIALVILIFRAARKRETKPDESVSDGQFTVSMVRVRKVYDEQQRLYRTEVVSDTSNGRMIDGHPLRTREDWDRWSKYDHQAMDCANVIRKCEKELKSSYCADPEKALQLAKDNYAQFERLCTQYGMWNYLIDDHAHYIPTAEQKQKSKVFIEGIAALVPTAIEKRRIVDEAAQVALSFLDSIKGKTGYRSDLTRHLSSQMEITPSEAEKLLRVLCNQNILRKSKNEQDRIVVRKARKRKDDENAPVS